MTFGDADSDLGATATSGLAVSYSSSTAGNCTIVSGKLHVVGAGTCTITAFQAGNDNWLAAPSEERTFTIAKKAQTISFTAPSGVTFGDADSDLGATATSGLAVSYSSSTAGNCTIVSGKLHVVGPGPARSRLSRPATTTGWLRPLRSGRSRSRRRRRRSASRRRLG